MMSTLLGSRRRGVAPSGLREREHRRSTGRTRDREVVSLARDHATRERSRRAERVLVRERGQIERHRPGGRDGPGHGGGPAQPASTGPPAAEQAGAGAAAENRGMMRARIGRRSSMRRRQISACAAKSAVGAVGNEVIDEGVQRRVIPFTTGAL